MEFLSKITPNRLQKAEKRDKLLALNIVSGIGVRGASMILSLIFVPLVLNYLTSYKYGIWLTINSVVAWFSMLDIGLTGGLRLKLQEALTIQDYSKSRAYISTTYGLLILIAIIAEILFSLLIWGIDIDFASFFKVNSSVQDELKMVVWITITGFLVRFTLQPISPILLADQRNFIQSTILLAENIVNLTGILILESVSHGSLIGACSIFSLSPLLVYTIYSIILFSGKYKIIRPSYKYVDRSQIAFLTKFGIDIFIINISLILLAQSNNLLITKLFNPNIVTEYNLVYKLFFTFSSLMTLIMTPLWSAFANAYNLNDYNWIEKTFKKAQLLFLLFSIIYVMMFFFGSIIIKMWTGMQIDNKGLFFVTLVYFVIQNYMMIYAFLFNGMGIIRLQRNMAIYGAVVNIPVIIFLVKILNIDVSAVLIGNTFAILPSLIIYPYIAKKRMKLLKKQ